MENLNSFQLIIDAFKAEYVNARNLKKSANSKKRAARNAASFNTRKETESTILETRLTSIESSLDSTLSTAFDSIDSVRFTDLSKKLAELKGKLSLFDAETDRLIELVNIDSEKYETWTSREQQAHQSLRDILVNAINEAEQSINDLYTGVDYFSVKSATIPSALTHPASEVVSYFMSLRSTFDSVKDDLKISVDQYTEDAFEVADLINEKSVQCIQDSKYLLNLKSELSDLLDSNALQTEIDSKEDQIDSHKSNMISSAIELKEAWAKFDSFIFNGSSNRFTQIIELAENLEDIYNETEDYRNENLNVLKSIDDVTFPHYSGYRILDVFSGVFNKISERVSFLLNIPYFNPGDGYRRIQIMGEQSSIIRSESEKTAIDSNDIFTQNPSTGYWELKKDVHPNLVSKYMTYQTNANPVTTLTRKNAELKSAQERLNFYITRFEEEGIDKINQIVDRYKISRSTFKGYDKDYDRLSNGYWIGTGEQVNQWNVLWDSINGIGGLWDSRITAFGELQKSYKRYSLHLGLFPEFYSIFETLNATKATAELYYDGLQPQFDSLTTNLSGIAALYGGDAGSIDASFVYGTGFNSVVYDMATQSDGKTLFCGSFSLYNGTDVNRIIRLNTDGSIDNTFNIGTGFDSHPRSMSIQSDGKIVVGGQFSSYNGTSANKIIRLNSDGSIDTSFVYGTGINGYAVYSISIQSDDKIVVGGEFTNYNGTDRNRIIRLNTDGSIDTSFSYGSGFNNAVLSTNIQSDGKIVVGGVFTNYDGTLAGDIIRLNSDGSVDTSFVYGTGFKAGSNNGLVYSTAFQSDGKIVVVGYFTNYNGTNANNIIRLNSDGSIDTSFVYGSGFNTSGVSIVIQSDGKIVVGGQFTSYNGTGANRLIRLNMDGTVDTSLVSNGNAFSDEVNSIAIQSDGKILVGGHFLTYNGTSANHITRLHSIDSYNPEYADAFYAATDALNVFISDVYTPAGDAIIATQDAYEEHIQGTYNVVGTYTRGGGDLADFFNDIQVQEQNYSIASVAVQTAESELATLEGQMTRSTPTDEDKRDRVKASIKAEQAYQMNMKFESDYLSGIDTLMYIINQKIDYAKSEAVNITDLLPSLTADAMAFITGESGSNPLFDSIKKSSGGYALRSYHTEMSHFEKEGFGEYGFNSLGIILNPNEISLIDVVNQNFIQDLRGYLEEKYIEYPRNISTLIINEVENGGSSF